MQIFFFVSSKYNRHSSCLQPNLPNSHIYSRMFSTSSGNTACVEKCVMPHTCATRSLLVCVCVLCVRNVVVANIFRQQSCDHSAMRDTRPLSVSYIYRCVRPLIICCRCRGCTTHTHTLIWVSKMRGGVFAFVVANLYIMCFAFKTNARAARPFEL